MAVKLSCTDLERVLLSQEPEMMEIMAAHARSCPRCSGELAKWSALSDAARCMQKQWESPYLWARIRHQLTNQAAPRVKSPVWEFFVRSITQWQIAVAAILMAVISASLLWVLVERSESTSETIRQISEKRLLTERAVRDVETSEAAYLHSIDQLSKLVQPRIQNPKTPLLTSYREKLKLLDAAIAECRANVDQNRFNAHLRLELLTLYQEKQLTLKELTKEE